LGDGAVVDPIPTTEGYGSWAEFYDQPGNQLIDLDRPIVREILDGLPRGSCAGRRLRHRDLVVCALALMHVTDLEPVLAEFVRVLRPGGSLVISDWRIVVGDTGIPVVKARFDGSPGYMPTHGRRTSEYLAAALGLGLQVRRCEEPLRPFPLVDGNGVSDGAPVPDHVPGAPPNIWALHRFCPAATNAAYRGLPGAIVLHFQFSHA
jgi:SAM-dependent methyltransferase